MQRRKLQLLELPASHATNHTHVTDMRVSSDADVKYKLPWTHLLASLESQLLSSACALCPELISSCSYILVCAVSTKILLLLALELSLQQFAAAGACLP